MLLFVISLQTDVGAVALFFKIRSPAYCIVLMFGENQKHNMCFGRELTHPQQKFKGLGFRVPLVRLTIRIPRTPERVR